MHLSCKTTVFGILVASLLTISSSEYSTFVRSSKLRRVPPLWEVLKTPKPDAVVDTNINLKEREHYPSDPLPRDINPKILLKKLGTEYDPTRTAITRIQFLARKFNSSRGNVDMPRRMLTQSMPTMIRNLDFKMPGIGRYLGPKASKKLQLWLWKISYCPILQKWKDLGVRFWPRYLNFGKCSKEATCSFPKGMRCQISERKVVKVLRWYCLDINKKRANTTCIWQKASIRVTTKCRCGCRAKQARTD